ncbi:MAG TPA: hypothetical protein VFY92_08150 [Hyphomicrobiaceae bacterium]|nr:hypothetical protein [Hyphomicrobiaceae bacterium]
MEPTDYRTRDHTESTMERMGETAQEAGRHAVSLTEDIADAIRERPLTTLAVAAGLAFAVGALWKLGPQRRQGSLDSLLRNLPEMPSRESIRDSILPRHWH